MTQSDVHTMVVSKAAAETLTAIGNQCASVAAAWGRHNPEMVVEMLKSATHNTTHLFSMFFGGESSISRDGELSLFVSTSSGFVYGVIFHPKHYRVDAPLDGDINNAYGAVIAGRYCMAPVEDNHLHPAGYCRQPFSGGSRTCDEDDHDAVPVAMPLPGTWGFHS